MVYLINKFVSEELSLPTIGRDDEGLIQLFDRNNDKFFIVDNYLDVSRFLNYANISYKLVVGIPGSKIDGEFIADKDHIILYDHFVKECTAVKQRSAALDSLKHELDVDKENKDVFEDPFTNEEV